MPTPVSLVQDRYQLVRVAGRGTFGRVFEVIDVQDGEHRALKVVPSGAHEALLCDEYEQLARLRHPSLPHVFEVGRLRMPLPEHQLAVGAPYFVAEWIAGERADARPWNGDIVALWTLLADVCGALATIHAAGLVHADVAPQNLLVAAGRTVLVDLGLATRFSDDGTPRGTPAFMAPEAFAGRLDPRSDLYGLAATVVRVVTGRAPFDADSDGIADGSGPGSRAQLHADRDEIAGGSGPGSRGGVAIGLRSAYGTVRTHADSRDDGRGLAAGSLRSGLGELVQRILTAPTPVLRDLPRGLADLLARMMARDPSARPASALAVLDELDQLAPAIAPSVSRRARPRVGLPPAPAIWPGAAPWIDALAASLAAAHSVVLVVGPAGAGRRQLVDAALARRQLDEVARGRPTRPVVAGSLDHVASVLDVPPAASAGAWLECAARAIRGARMRVVVELGDDPRAGELLAALARSNGDHPTIAIVDESPAGRDLSWPAVATHRTPTLDLEGISALAEAMLDGHPPRDWCVGLFAASEGQPLTAIELIRSLAHEDDPFVVDWRARSSDGMVELRIRTLRTAPDGAQLLAAAVTVWGGRTRIERALATARCALATSAPRRLFREPDQSVDGPALMVGLGDVVELERRGLVQRHGAPGPVELAIDRATADAVRQVFGLDALAELAGFALEALGVADQHELRTPLLEYAALDEGRANVVCDVAEHLLARGRADRALALARRAFEVAPSRAHLVAARASSATGAYRDAVTFARRARDAGADAIEAELVAARAQQRAADLDAAEETLARLHAAHSAHPEVAGAYARLLVTRSRYADARAVAIGSQPTPNAVAHEPIPRKGQARVTEYRRLESGVVMPTASDLAPQLDSASAPPARGTPLTGLRAESAGLAAFYLGDLDEADAAFAALELGASTANDSVTVGRALSLRGMVAQQRGQLGLASDRYREATRRLELAGELHAAATAELNLGTVLAERGRASEALPRLAAAGRVFAELGATTELVAAELNRGNALIAVGQLDDARHAAESAIARSEKTPHLRAFALLVGGDVRRHLGDDAGATRAYREALAIGTERGDAHAQISAYVALAEAGHRDGAGVDVEALCASADDRDRWTLARCRLALRDAGLQGSTAFALAKQVGEVARRASDGDRLERAFRGYALAAQLALRARDVATARAEIERGTGEAGNAHLELELSAAALAMARAEADRALGAHAMIVAAAAPAFRAALDADPERQALLGAFPREPPVAALRAGSSDAGHTSGMRRLLALSRRLNSEASLERILDEAIDTAIELTSAERGFLLLRQTDGELAPVVSRNFIASDLAGGPSVSRSIAERASQTGEPVLTVDAGVDERFGAAASVAALRLRSVLAVPLRQRGAITGCIYVDHRLRGGAFDDAAAGVLGELADIAAIAIENARLADNLRRSTHEVAELNARLSAELAERDAELVRVRADLPDRDRLRHRYERIVGRSPAMVRMLDIVDRAAATSLPVVIVGESGTGKELVARALHDNGPRRAGPFVAINCSAVPEPLLESELFGHVRGSFTGADRDRRGLFEVADGGTLFLDEVADTGVAMQAKLLRVLQDGVLRRVGDAKTRHVDVRVVAASQRSLVELVAAGRFREDLRYRLEVITVPVPALRERDGDVPLLVEQILAQLSPDRAPPRVTRAAARALGQHRWPGNVRELENALARGIAMGGDVIDLADLPESIAASTGRPEPAKPAVGDDLRLRPALAATEQAYISAAMSRAKNNQTVAARLLGLSRFGLQKKLRRLTGDE